VFLVRLTVRGSFFDHCSEGPKPDNWSDGLRRSDAENVYLKQLRKPQIRSVCDCRKYLRGARNYVGAPVDSRKDGIPHF
jgi:hypothetical protein